MVENPRVAVILVNYNNEEDTIQCLETLSNQTLDNFLTIVVDNGSEDQSIQKIANKFEFPVYLQNETNRGFTGGNNRGIKYALDQGAEWILLLNNDTEIESTFLDKFVTSAMDLPDDAGVIGPKIHTYKSKKLWAAGGEINPVTGATTHRTGNNNKFEGPEKVDYVIGAALLVRADVFRDIGLLDDDFFIYFEETEFCQRAQEFGWSVWFVPVSGVYHKESVDYSYSAFREYYFTRNRWLLVKKTQPIPVRALFYPYFMFRWILLQAVYLLAVKRDIAAAKSTVIGGKDALFGNTGKQHD